jgi:Flp pilus assembly protein TadG
MRIWRRSLRGNEGSEIAEMAMVLPVMFFVFLGIFWIGRMYNIYATVNQAARAGARTAAQASCGSCGNTAGTNAAVDAAVSNILQSDRLDPAHITAPVPAPSLSPCPGLSVTCTNTGHNIAVCRNALLTPVAVPPAVCGVMVEFSYTLDLNQIVLPLGGGLQGVLPQPRIAARAQMTVEQ